MRRLDCNSAGLHNAVHMQAPPTNMRRQVPAASKAPMLLLLLVPVAAAATDEVLQLVNAKAATQCCHQHRQAEVQEMM